MIDVLVIGSGLTGGTVARKLADCGKRVLILEKRNHIGGNVYDEMDDGILVQRYGPHLFYTEMDEVYDFLSRFTEFIPYVLKAASCVDGHNLSMPFNFSSIDFFYEESQATKLKAKLLTVYPRKIVTILDLLENEDADIHEYGEILFEKDYRLYSAKQWGISPEQIDVSVFKRVPVFLSYRDTRFDKKYQGLPKYGFTAMMQKLLEHPNIEIRFGIDALDVLQTDFSSGEIFYKGELFRKPVIYTGPLDDIANKQYGSLPYRSLEIIYEKYPVHDYLEYAAIAYPQAEGYVRKTEYTKLPWQEVGDKTIVATEYPVVYGANNYKSIGPAYPLLTQANMELHDRYKRLCSRIENLHICGRLGDYRYYDMDQAVKMAMHIAGKIM